MQQIIGNFPTHGCDQSTIFYNMVGNFVPPEWQRLTDSSGKVLTKTARQLLSLILSCFETEPDISTDELQESYYFFEQQLGVCQRRVRQCLVELQQAGFINVELLTIIKHHIKCRIPSIKLLKNFKSLKQENILRDRKNFQIGAKEISGQAEKSFRLERNNFQPLNIIDNNISILESRSTKSDFANFANVNDSACQEPPSFASPGLLSKVVTKAKNLCGFRKKLAEFHLLDEGDASLLQIQSGRELTCTSLTCSCLNLARNIQIIVFRVRRCF